jgi:peptidoglycan/LPS O-acetylase OafA/YrhL
MDGLPYYLAYLQNIPQYWGAVTPPIDNTLAHTWTLAIEEQFYLIWPPLLMLVGRRYLTPLSLFFIVLPAVLRGFGLSRLVLFGHCDGLALGALLASLKMDAPLPAPPRESRFYLAACAVMAGLYGARCSFLIASGHTGKQLVSDNVATILISLVYFALIGFTVCSAGRPGLRFLRIPALVYLGQLSYGLYLYHWIVYGYIDLVIKFGMGYRDPWWLDVIKVGASFAVAVFSWHFIEQPILALKDRWSYARSRPGGRDGDAIPPRHGRETEASLEPVGALEGRPVQEVR